VVVTAFVWELFKTEEEIKTRGILYSRGYNYHEYHHAAVVGTYVWQSIDNGKTFNGPVSKIEHLDDLDLIATSEPPVELQDGTLVIPVYGRKGDVSKCVFLQSGNKGLTWEKLSVLIPSAVHKEGFSEPALGYFLT